jgi:arginine deiminase
VEIDIRSEIGPLREVLVHRPGEEIVRMTQHDLERMLFDDILSPAETLREHDLMCDILARAGARVRYLQDMLRDALARAPVATRESLVERCCRLAGIGRVAPVLAEWPTERLATALVTGVDWAEIPANVPSLARLRSRLADERALALMPLPNLMFMRDPCIAVHDQVVVGRMATAARAREPLLTAFALRAAGAPVSFDGEDAGRSDRGLRIEGGDVLAIAPEFLIIGCSQRTSPQTVERLAEEALFPAHPELRRIYVVMMPQARSVMHLDTILTQVDRQLFLGHAPLIVGSESRPALPVGRVLRDGTVEGVEGASVLDVLREELGREVQLVPCGGADPLHQEREQWTDGANAVAVSPGHIVLYARNTHTIQALAAHGFTEVALSVVQPPEERAARIAQGLERPRTVFSFTGSELSRARGGGRCLTMPLVRA